MNELPLDQEKKVFLSILAHELRNPLAVILSSIELLKLQGTDTPDTPALLQSIEDRARIMTGMLEDLLNSPQVFGGGVAPETLPSAVAPAGEESELHSAVLPPDGGYLTVLVVDDNELAANALGKLLQLRGYTVIFGYSGSEALQKAMEFRPHIIILDIGLSDMDGYEVARRIHEQKDFSPILIALTGYGQSEDKEKALRAGFLFHLTKPVGLRDIEETFQKIPRASRNASH